MADTGYLLDAALAAALAVPAAGLGRLARRRPLDQRWLRLLALGAVTELGAGLLRVAREATSWAPLHWVSDPLTLLAPLLLLSGLVLALRQRMGGVRLNVLLDGLGGALAAAAVASLAVMPLVHRLWDGSWSGVVGVGRPLLAATLLSAAIGALGLLGHGHARQLGAWTVGFGAVLAADTARSMGLLDSVEASAWAGGLTVLGFALLALGAGCRCPDQRPQVPGPRSLTIPSLASLAAVAVLTVAPEWDSSPLPSVGALATLAVCSLRFVRVFFQLRELADIREQALTDELTGVPNRRALYLHLDGLLDPGAAEATGADGEPPTGPPEFAVALIDLDHFKEVNDTLGHAVGDAMLKGVTARFLGALDELETPYLFARLGGDEFAIVLAEATSRNAAMIVGEALLESLAEPLELGEAVVHAQASIGLAVSPTHGSTRGEILFAADAAMYAAKTSGERVRFHAPQRDEKSAQLGLAEELYAALERHEIVVSYQPICTLDGAVVAAEALMRWEHPERGRLLPGEFLPAAERYKLTGAIAQRVLDVALLDLGRWRSYGVPMTVSVNLTGADLRDDGIVATVAEALLAHRLPPEALTIDVNERDLTAADLPRIAAVLTALHELGVGLALDDFGSGGVGIGVLSDLPFDEVKLERRFVRDVDVSERGTGVVRACLDLVHTLGMRMVAEGVEDRRALARLTDLGCDLVQGTQVGRPCSTEGIQARLSRPTTGKHRLLPAQPGHGEPHAAADHDGRRGRGITTSGQ